MIENVELSWLTSFQNVYEKGSFKSAAEQLQQPSSNISRHVALLEQQLNVRLLERTTRRVTPTVLGTQLYQSIAPLTSALDDALKETAQHGRSLIGHLKMITPDLPFLADILADFSVQHPDIKLSCDTQLNPTEGLLAGYDIVLSFGRGPLKDSGWVAQELLRWPSGVVASPRLLSHTDMPSTLEDLSNGPCITSLSVLQGMPWRFKGDINLPVHSTYKVNSGHMAKAAALKGLGFAILPLPNCQEEIARGTLVHIPIDPLPEDLVLYAFYSGRRYPLEKVTAFLTFLKAQLTSDRD